MHEIIGFVVRLIQVTKILVLMCKKTNQFERNSVPLASFMNILFQTNCRSFVFRSDPFLSRSV